MKRFSTLLCVGTALFCTLHVSGALAQAAPSGPLVDALNKLDINPKDKSLFAFDYGIPTSPALALIGTSNALSAPSAALKPFVFSVPASWGGAKDSQAFAVDFSLLWAVQGASGTHSETYEEYINEDWLGQLRYRTRFNGALSLGDDGNGDPTKAKPSRLAFGLSASLLRDSDPLSATAPNGNTSVWKDCVDGVFTGTTNTQYEAALRRDPSTVAVADLAHYRAKEKVAFGPPGLPALAAAAFADLQNCLKPGEVCATYDTKNALQTAVTNHDLAAADAALNDIQAAASAASDAASVTMAVKAGIPKALGACVTAANAAARLGADLDIGGGVVWNGTPGKVEGFTDAGGALWLSGRLPLNGVFQPDIAKLGPDTASVMIGGALRASWSQTLSTGVAATPFFKADVYDAWFGLERYTASSRFAAQVGYVDTQAIDTAFKTFSKSGTRWLVSASFRADKVFGGLLGGTFLIDKPTDTPKNGLWLNVTYGSSGGTVTTLDDKTVMVSLSYSPSDPYNLFGEGPDTD